MIKNPEVWLRGTLPKMHNLLQPVAYALLQAKEELKEMLMDFPEEKLWIKLYGLPCFSFTIFNWIFSI